MSNYLSNIIDWPAGCYGYDRILPAGNLEPTMLLMVMEWPHLYASHATLSRN